MFLLWIVLELVFDIFGSILLEIVLGVTHSLDEDKGAKGVASVWLTVVGAVIGLATLFVAPERLLDQGPIPGLSLLLVPLALGAAMELWGRIRNASAKNVSHLGTWYGGAALGLGLSAGRLIGLAFAHDVRALHQ